MTGTVAAPSEHAEQARTGWRDRPAFAPLAHRDFALFWLAAIVSNAGQWMQVITVPYVVYRITGSATWLGVTAAATMIPSLLCNPLSATLTDRFERRRILLGTQCVQMATAFALWASWVAGARSIAVVLGLVVAGGIAAGITMPAWQSLITQLVPREQLGAAVRLNSLQFSTGRAVGPFIGGFVLGRFGPGVAFLGNGVTYLFVLAALVFMRTRLPAPGAQGSPFAQITDGWRYLWNHPSLLLSPLSVFFIGGFGWGVMQLAPAIVQEQFGLGRSSIGTLMGVYGVGCVAAIFPMSWAGDRVPRSVLVRVALAMWVGGLVVLSATGAIGVGLVGVFVMGAAHVLGLTTLNTAIQMQVDDAYRGRTLAAHLQGMYLGAPVGSLLLGRLTEATSVQTATRVAAAVLLAYVAFGVVRLGAFRGLDADVAVPRVR